jgi:hypothetical protein
MLSINSAEPEDVLVTLVEFCQTPRTVIEMMKFVNRKSRDKFMKAVLKPALEQGVLVMTDPDLIPGFNNSAKTVCTI